MTESVPTGSRNKLRGAHGDQRGPLWKRLCRPLMFFVLGILVLSTWALFHFGSFGNAMAYVRGRSLVAERTTISAGEVQPGTKVIARFRLRNLSFRPVTVVGAARSCACVVVDELPLTIRPGSVADLSLQFKAIVTPADAEVEHTVLLMLDVDNPPIVLKATARALKSKSG